MSQATGSLPPPALEGLKTDSAAVVASVCSACSTVPRVRLLAALAACDHASRKELAQTLDEPPDALRYSIKILRLAGLVEETRTAAGAKCVECVYALTARGRRVQAALLALPGG